MFGWEVTTAPHLADNLGTNILFHVWLGQPRN